MITANDELRHPAEEDPNWSESYYFTFADLQQDIAGFFRIGLEKNKNQSNMWCSVFHAGKVVYQRFQLNLPYNEAGLENLSVGDLQMQMVEALRAFDIRFSDGHLTLDLRWTAYHDVFDMHDAMGEMSGSVAKGHYEQAGEVTGSVTFNDQTLNIHGYGFRDHSWGARDWNGIKCWKTCVAHFGKEFAFASGEITELNGNTSHLGYLYDGEQLNAIQSASITLDNNAAPKSGEVTLIQHNGTSTKMDIEFMAICHMPYGHNELLECYVKVYKDGECALGIVEINRRLS